MKRIFKGILYYAISMILILDIVYISGFYIELSKHAYFDIFRSYSIVYVAIIIFENKKTVYNTKFNKTDRTVEAYKINIAAKVIQHIQSFFHWLIGGKIVFEEVCKIFTIVTLISNILMVLHVDISKAGTFAYIHLLSRLLIVLVIVVIIEVFIERENIWVEIKNSIKIFRNNKNLTKVNRKIVITNYIIKNKYKMICILFTMIIFTVCIIALLLYPSVKGGIGLDQKLLILLGIITGIVFTDIIKENS